MSATRIAARANNWSRKRTSFKKGGRDATPRADRFTYIMQHVLQEIRADKIRKALR